MPCISANLQKLRQFILISLTGMEVEDASMWVRKELLELRENLLGPAPSLASRLALQGLVVWCEHLIGSDEVVLRA